MKKTTALINALVLTLVLTLALTFSLNGSANQTTQAHISAHISKTFAFPVSMLQKVEASIQDASARKGDAMKQDISYEIDANEHLSVTCPSNSPIVYDGHLYGCALEFVVDLGQGVTATARNMLYITQSSSEVQDILNKTDSSKTNLVQLKTVFDGGHGSSYYCAAGGATGWNCFLNFID